MKTQEAFDEWHSSPLTKEFFKFLSDKREDLKETWAKGQPIDDKAHAIAMVYGDILDLEFSTIAEFYNIEIDEKEDEKNDDENEEPHKY